MKRRLQTVRALPALALAAALLAACAPAQPAQQSGVAAR